MQFFLILKPCTFWAQNGPFLLLEFIAGLLSGYGKQPKKALKMAKMCTVSMLERQFATLYLFHAPTCGGGGVKPNFADTQTFLNYINATSKYDISDLSCCLMTKHTVARESRPQAGIAIA